MMKQQMEQLKRELEESRAEAKSANEALDDCNKAKSSMQSSIRSLEDENKRLKRNLQTNIESNKTIEKMLDEHSKETLMLKGSNAALHTEIESLHSELIGLRERCASADKAFEQQQNLNEMESQQLADWRKRHALVLEEKQSLQDQLRAKTEALEAAQELLAKSSHAEKINSHAEKINSDDRKEEQQAARVDKSALRDLTNEKTKLQFMLKAEKRHHLQTQGMLKDMMTTNKELQQALDAAKETIKEFELKNMDGDDPHDCDCAKNKKALDDCESAKRALIKEIGSLSMKVSVLQEELKKEKAKKLALQKAMNDSSKSGTTSPRNKRCTVPHTSAKQLTAEINLKADLKRLSDDLKEKEQIIHDLHKRMSYMSAQLKKGVLDQIKAERGGSPSRSDRSGRSRIPRPTLIPSKYPWSRMAIASEAEIQRSLVLQKLQTFIDTNPYGHILRHVKENAFVYGTRKIHIYIVTGELNVRVGGGYVTLQEFCAK
mmetsp:Transcript_21949/g.42708  ORF Transcript_21949/g.42708 Transcript_21949/m.42708 type:complete len:489 (+) Transcript_21949:1550-3016(+)